ncbi:FAD-binding oxidoreductase [Lentzea sp. NPDC060358]|uniref:FAD-binding oxidoreductase n=1 Tax=Lentzea sp. NPDC060358 TaxID=3347103 RepID=UPI0036661904
MGTGGRAVRWEALASRLSGGLVLPGAEDYDSARQLQLAEFDSVRPGAVARCETEDDVVACLEFARAHDVHLVPRSGRHSFAGWSTTEGLVVDLSALDHVAVRGDVVHVGPGAQSVDVLESLEPHGVAVATGICPTVCAGGYLSGGGIGFQARKHGVASDRMVSARVVLADGRVVDCSAEEEPDLFWALRGGGGGNFGIVTDFAVRPFTTERMTGFTVMWQWDQALDLLETWPHWLAAAPRELGAETGVFLQDADPSATPVVLMIGTYLGARAQAEAALGELFSVAGLEPAMQQVHDDRPYHAAMAQFYETEGMSRRQRRRTGDNPEAVLPRQAFLRERHRLVSTPFARQTVADALEVFDGERRAGQLRYFAYTGLGGAVNEVASDATAYAHRDTAYLAKFTLSGEQAPGTDEDEAAARAWVDRGFDTVDPHSNGHCYVNSPDPDLQNWQWAYYGDNHPRLAEVKKSVDPDGFFRFPQAIGS